MFDLTCPTISPAQESALAQLFSPTGPPKYVLGCNGFSESVARAVPVTAYVDDFTPETSFKDKPVVRLDALPQESVVVSCAVAMRPLTALRRLQTVGVRWVLDYFTLSRLQPELFPAPTYLEGSREDILQNLPHYERLYQRLADEPSRLALRNVTSFRATRELEHMRGFTLATDHQYFEDFLNLGEGEVFVDGGGFDGQTSLKFHARCPRHQRIHFFEPSPEMLVVARRNLRDVPRVEFIQKGLFHRASRVRFDASGGTGSCICETGGLEIEVTSLDEAVAEPVSFIKLDVEGAEYDALQGANGHIARHHPKLAVCVYHRQDDFWRIPELVLRLYPAYQVFFRHYTEGILESVMFFIPLSA